jgi:ADP-ribose pyrophosphatase YjhB (NUDIX family)
MIRRDYSDAPIVGVGAAVYREDEVLLIKRGNPPLAGTWSLPGGRIHRGEDLPSAVFREILEECSIEVRVGDLITIFEYIEQDAESRVKYHYIVFDFRADYARGKLEVRSDALDARWVPINQLKSFDLTSSVIEVIGQGIKISETGT